MSEWVESISILILGVTQLILALHNITIGKIQSFQDKRNQMRFEELERRLDALSSKTARNPVIEEHGNTNPKSKLESKEEGN